METFAYAASALVGISLGLIGGGGSILTVPVLVYLFGINPLLSTSYSLFIVGSTSLIGAFDKYRKGLLNIQVAFTFGLSSIITVYLIRRYFIPVIPEVVVRHGTFLLTRDFLTMFLFALLMILAAIAMIRNSGTDLAEGDSKKTLTYTELSLAGVAIGITTGLLGAGSGFLLIPALVLFVGLPMKKAIGTSLLIIALNSLAGFIGDLGHFHLNWIFLFKITSITIAGIFIGGAVGAKVDGQKLKGAFGWFVLTMGAYIVIKEILFNKG